jgi:hypothetical protein
MPPDDTSTASDATDTGTSTDTSTTTDTATTTAPDSTDTGGADDTSTVAEIAAVAAELGITPGQLKGRLEASKKWEQRAKKADEDAEAARRAAMSDQERAVEEARNAGKADAASEYGQRVAAAELRAALTGLVPDPTAIVEDLNLAKFVNEDGSVNTDEVARVRSTYEGVKPTFQGSADAGAQGGTVTEPTLDEQIAAAEKAGNVRLVMQLQNRKLTAPAASS